MSAIEVELPVCGKCGRAGKIPRNSTNGKILNFYCTGGEGRTHRKEKMEYRRFREVTYAR
jgi:hypothetical protein